jgi:hypothetical protein
MAVAVAVSAVPFHDVGVACAAPAVAGVHGQRAALVPSPGPSGGDRYVALSDAQVRFLTTTRTVPGIDGFPKFSARIPRTPIVVLCRGPARTRVGYSIVLVGISLLGVAIARTGRERAVADPALSELTPASGAA